MKPGYMCVCVHVFACMHPLSHVQLFATPWIAAHQAPPWNFPGKNTEVG